MKVVYPRTKTEDVDAAAKQLLNGRVKIYEETIFKDLPVERSKEALQKYEKRRDFCDTCETIQGIGGVGGAAAIIIGYLALSSYLTLGVIVGVGGIISVLGALGLKLFGNIVDNLPQYQIRRDDITRVYWEDDGETKFPFFECGKYGSNTYYFPDKESYEKAKQCIKENEDIIKSNDELFRLTQKLKKVGSSLRTIDKIKNFINDCAGKVDVMVSPVDTGYKMQIKENDTESRSDNGKIMIKGREFSLDLSREDFKKIFAKEGIIDFSYLDGSAEDCVKSIYDWSGKAMPMLEDKMPMLPDKLAQDSAECEIIEI